MANPNRSTYIGLCYPYFAWETLTPALSRPTGEGASVDAAMQDPRSGFIPSVTWRPLSRRTGEGWGEGHKKRGSDANFANYHQLNS
jgi:hypothetical protein